MLAEDRDSLACDLAETYGVLDMEALPVKTLAVLSFGLRENSRIKMRLAKSKIDMQTLMLAGCFDMLSAIAGALFGYNGPRQSLYAIMSGKSADSGEAVGFDSAEDYERAREDIIRRAQNGYGTG